MKPMFSLQKFSSKVRKLIQFLDSDFKWTIFGFFLLICYVFDRFIRKRLDRDISTNIDSLFFLCLILICVGYLYAIYRVIKPKPLSKLTLLLLEKPKKAVINLGRFVKNNILKENGYKSLTVFFTRFVSYKYFYFKILVLVCNLLPHVILILILLLDIFYFEKLHYFYGFIGLNILTFILPFMLFSFNYQLDFLRAYWKKYARSVTVTYVYGILDPKYDFWHDDYEESEDEEPEAPTIMQIDFDKFIKVYCQYTADPDKKYLNYTLYRTREWYNTFEHRYDIKSKEYKEIIDSTEKDISLIVSCFIILQDYNFIMNKTNFQYIVKYVKITIFFVYFCLWFYILYVSGSGENILDVLQLLKDISHYMEEPITQDLIIKDYHKMTHTHSESSV